MNRRGAVTIGKQAAALAAVVLMLAAALCLFDRDADGNDDFGADLCAMLFTAPAVGIMVAAVGFMISAMTPLIVNVYLASLQLPDPPPKSVPVES